MTNLVNPLAPVYRMITDIINCIPPFVMHMFYLFVLLYVGMILIKMLNNA